MEIEQELKLINEQLDNYMEAQIIDVVSQKRQILELVHDQDA